MKLSFRILHSWWGSTLQVGVSLSEDVLAPLARPQGLRSTPLHDYVWPKTQS